MNGGIVTTNVHELAPLEKRHQWRDYVIRSLAIDGVTPPTLHRWDLAPVHPGMCTMSVALALNLHERSTVEAVFERLFPGTESEPGAVAIGAAEYLDVHLPAHIGITGRPIAPA